MGAFLVLSWIQQATRTMVDVTMTTLHWISAFTLQQLKNPEVIWPDVFFISDLLGFWAVFLN